MHIGTPNIHWLTMHGLVMAVAVLYYVISTHVMQQRRQPAAAIAWMLFIVLLPYLALPAFMVFGSRKLRRPHCAVLSSAAQTQCAHNWASVTIEAMGQPAPVVCADLNIHANGQQALQALLQTIDAATQSIDLCTFILGRDEVGDQVIDHLCAKAREGVKVRVLLDGMGSLMAHGAKPKRLVEAGGEFTLFVPPLRSPLKGRTNLRDHRKLLVIDAKLPSGKLWCGGRNLASEYFTGSKAVPPWRDLSFDVRGALVLQAHALFECDWAFANRAPRPEVKIAPRMTMSEQSGCAQLVASGPDQGDDTIYALLVTAAYRAQRRIELVTPYFVPDATLLMALCLAARRGVSVNLLLPAHSNHKLSDLARTRALRALSEAGAHVWLAPGMLHAKLVVVDDVLALAGSANLDSRSLFLNYELMVAFHGEHEVRGFAKWAELERQTAHRYAAHRPGLMRDVAEGMLLWLGFQL